MRGEDRQDNVYGGEELVGGKGVDYPSGGSNNDITNLGNTDQVLADKEDNVGTEECDWLTRK